MTRQAANDQHPLFAGGLAAVAPGLVEPAPVAAAAVADPAPGAPDTGVAETGPAATAGAAPALRRKSRFLKNLRENDKVAGDIFLITECGLRTTSSGKKQLLLELADRTGRLPAVAWDRAAETLAAVAAVDRYVEVGGSVGTYQKQLQIRVESLREVPEEQVDPADYLPASRRSPEDMERELREFIAGRDGRGGIRAPYWRALVESFYADPVLGPQLRRAPAAKQIHHAAIGGLLEHTLAVAGLCRLLAERYGLDADLLVTGALLHDLGKVREYSWARRFDYTDEGRLVGHLVIGAEMITQRAAELEGKAMARAADQPSAAGQSGDQAAGDLHFPEDELLHLRHLILSHHGQYEWGSPKRPKTAEALVLHFADDLDGKLNQVEECVEAERERDPASRWTPYHRTLDRYLYVRKGQRRGTAAPSGPEPDGRGKGR